MANLLGLVGKTDVGKTFAQMGQQVNNFAQQEHSQRMEEQRTGMEFAKFQTTMEEHKENTKLIPVDDVMKRIPEEVRDIWLENSSLHIQTDPNGMKVIRKADALSTFDKIENNPELISKMHLNKYSFTKNKADEVENELTKKKTDFQKKYGVSYDEMIEESGEGIQGSNPSYQKEMDEITTLQTSYDKLYEQASQNYNMYYAIHNGLQSSKEIKSFVTPEGKQVVQRGASLFNADGTQFTGDASKLRELGKSEGSSGTSEFSVSISNYRKDFQEQHGRLPSPSEENAWIQQRKESTAKASAPSVSVKVGGKIEEVQASAGIKNLEEGRKIARDARRAIDNYDNMLKLVAQGAAGPEANLKAKAAPYFKILGIEMKGASKAQEFQAKALALAGSMRMDVVGPGPVTNFEQEILQKAAGAGWTLAQTAQALIEEYKRQADIKIRTYNEDVDNFYASYPNQPRLFKPLEMTGSASPNTPKSAGNKQLTSDEAREYLKRAGGDKNKARDLARKDGRTF